MSGIALVTWFAAIAIGLILLTIWLIEYDRDYQSAAATRLPVPVLFLHALLALAGLAIWVIYLVEDKPRLAWSAVIILAVVALLGLIMAARWIPVRRAVVAARRSGGGPGWSDESALPPERNFPLPVVVSHGVVALATVTLVLLTALGAGGS